MMPRRGRWNSGARVLPFVFLAMTACGEYSIAGPSASQVYELQISTSAGEVTSVLLQFADVAGPVTVLPSHVAFSRVVSLPEARALLVGDLAAGTTIRATASTVGTAPSAVVLEAAGNSVAGYAPISPATVELRWTRMH